MSDQIKTETGGARAPCGSHRKTGTPRIPPVPGDPDRIASLDALRGLAALTVVVQHVLSTYGTLHSWSIAAAQNQIGAFLATRTPLGIFHAGDAAVILFFTLSGFVLALPFLSGRAPSYSSFAIRRVCRIYLPYAAALFIALAARSLVHVELMKDTPHWTQTFWWQPPTLGAVAGYLAMTGFIYHTRIDFVVWSLIHEMRISLMFPLLIAATARTRFKVSIPAAFVFSFACEYLAQGVSLQSIKGQAIYSALQTGSYVCFFIVGIELARHRRALAAWMQTLRRPAVAAMALMSACLYCASFLVPEFPAYISYIVGFGAAGFIVLSFGRKRFDLWLTRPWLLFLGRISYSLYLLHPIVLLTLVYSLHRVWSPVAILAAVFPISIIAAWMSWRFIECPSMWLGRRLTQRVPAYEELKLGAPAG